MEKTSVSSHFSNTPKITTPKRSILVIDDCHEILFVQRTLLELEGFEVFTAQSGTEALTLLSEMDPPNLILLDMQMQDMSGPEFLTWLEVKKPEIKAAVPIVFVTGMPDVPKGETIGIINKPFDVNHFISDVHRFIEMGSIAPFKH